MTGNTRQSQRGRWQILTVASGVLSSSAFGDLILPFPSGDGVWGTQGVSMGSEMGDFSSGHVFALGAHTYTQSITINEFSPSHFTFVHDQL